MRICTRLASTELTLFSRLGATSGATNRQRLFLLGCHGYMLQRCSAKSCSIVNRLTSELGILPFFFAVNGEFGLASIAGSCKQSEKTRLLRHESGPAFLFDLSIFDQTLEFRNEKVVAELFASETKCAVRFVRKSCLSIRATRSSRAPPGKPRMNRQEELQCVSSPPFVRCCSRW